MRFAALGVVAFGALVASATAASSCQGLPEGETCSDIPDGGCPIDRGGSCADPTCDAIFLCNNGLWSLETKCPAQQVPEGGTGSGGSGTGGSAPTPCTTDPVGDAGCTVVNLDAGDTATECTPDLMDGDCPWQVAQGSCVECVCLTGCLDFYTCTPAGWVSVAYCDDSGDFIVSSQ